MPLTVDQLLEIRFSRTLKGPEKVNAYRDLASKSLRFDREIREFAFCARCLFLQRHADSMLSRRQIELIDRYTAQGGHFDNEGIDTFIRKYGLTGHYPSYLRIPPAREDIFLDLWARRDIEVRNGYQQTDIRKLYGPEAEDWVTYFGLQVLAKQSGGEVIPSFYPVPGLDGVVKSYRPKPNKYLKPDEEF